MRVINAMFEFIINWYWIGTLEKVFWSIFITEGVWLLNWTVGGMVVSEKALEAITFKALDYLGWVALININLFIITGFIKWLFNLFNYNVPDEWRFGNKPREHTS
jgi:hypothetical protein